MDAAPSFGVSMISEVPSNPQLTLVGRYVIFYVGNWPFYKVFSKHTRASI